MIVFCLGCKVKVFLWRVQTKICSFPTLWNLNSGSDSVIDEKEFVKASRQICKLIYQNPQISESMGLSPRQILNYLKCPKN